MFDYCENGHVAQPSGCRIETRLDASRSKSLGCRAKSVETSLDAADTSVRATKAPAWSYAEAAITSRNADPSKP
jgi:hypothetical protein